MIAKKWWWDSELLQAAYSGTNGATGVQGPTGAQGAASFTGPTGDLYFLDPDGATGVIRIVTGNVNAIA